MLKIVHVLSAACRIPARAHRVVAFQKHGRDYEGAQVGECAGIRRSEQVPQSYKISIGERARKRHRLGETCLDIE
jgi:hypothetical protein